MMSAYKYTPTVAIDFDGVIHSYVSPFTKASEILDPPVEGIKEVINDLHQRGFKVVVMSSRCLGDGGKDAIINYLNLHDIVVDDVTHEKVGAIAYIDDRAITFDGKVDGLVERIINFSPWNRKKKQRSE